MVAWAGLVTAGLNAEETPELPPWKTNHPIITVRKELYREHPRPAAAALVSVFQNGPGLERMEIHAVEARDDVPSESKVRFSTSNGRSWSDFTPRPETMTQKAGIEVWEGGGCKLFDVRSGVFVESWLRQIAIKGNYNCFTYLRYSRDGGRSWSEPKQLRYEEGADFDPSNPLKLEFLLKNQAYFGSNILAHSNGTLIHPVAHANAPGDPENDTRAWRMGSLCFIGKWEADKGDYRWRAGKRVEISPEVSSRGLMEPEAAELKDGRIFVVWRGSNTAKTPGRKWFSVSNDGGETLAPPDELHYDDGSRFYSPSSYHRMIRRSRDGKLYWIGNICPEPPNANLPRFPLVIAEVDETIPALRKKTVTAIDDRNKDQGPDVQFSNFSLLENRETGEFELWLTTYGEDTSNVYTSDCYHYVVAFPNRVSR